VGAEEATWVSWCTCWECCWVIGAFVYGAHQAGLSETWVGIVPVALLGAGIMGGIVKTRKQDPS
jgi:hypothetical protein